MNGAQAVLDRISEFHGHLGPFVVVGYRMGDVANRALGADPFGKTALVLAGGKPPRSCIVDGIQVSSGCTLGKGEIAVVDQGEVAAIFVSKADGRSIKVKLKNPVLERITAVPREEMEALAKELYSRSDEDLFEVRLEV
ncbi:MAG: formylmethanofuran dehydrogenase subunit E family protein [Methanobacteriota archaeon]|nr:MAG: formylmethanofuran dehydrogenase subunit E family protein [Euryarchaeota archaeon]